MTRKQTILLILGVLLVVATLVLWVLPSWLWHPLGLCAGTPVQVRDCKGYNSWSGSFSDISEITLVLGAFSWWVHTRCDSLGCLRSGKHATADGQHKLCRHCHPDMPNRRLSRLEIHARHHAAKNERNRP